MKDASLSKCLSWLFIAQILAILSFIPVVGFVLAIIAFVMNLMALHAASKFDQNYHTAFILSIAGVVLSLIDGFAKGIFSTIVGILSTLISLGIIYYVCTTTANHVSDPTVAASGIRVWKINLYCAIAAVILSILLLIPVINVIAAVLSVVVAIVELVGYILYLIFLNKSSKLV